MCPGSLEPRKAVSFVSLNALSYCPRPLTVAWLVVLKEGVAAPVPKKAQRCKMLRQPPGVRLQSGAVLSARGSPLSPPQS